MTITDSLEAVAAQSFGSSRRLTVAGAKAGMDLMLFGTWYEALDGQDSMAKMLHSGSLKRRAFRESVDRIIELRRQPGG